MDNMSINTGIAQSGALLLKDKRVEQKDDTCQLSQVEEDFQFLVRAGSQERPIQLLGEKGTVGETTYLNIWITNGYGSTDMDYTVHIQTQERVAKPTKQKLSKTSQQNYYSLVTPIGDKTLIVCRHTENGQFKLRLVGFFGASGVLLMLKNAIGLRLKTNKDYQLVLP